MSESTATQPKHTEPRGAVEYTGANAKFLHIKYGCLCEVSKRQVAGWTEHEIVDRDTGAITTKWIKIYKSLEAWVNKLEWYSREHQGTDYMGWKMHMSAGDTNYVLDLPLNNPATKKFMLSALNINFERPLEIKAWTDRETGKLAFWLQQDGESILQYYKKGDMKTCPEPQNKIGIGGKEKWDWEETNTFLWNEMQDRITPHIEKCAADRGYKGSADAAAASGVPTHTGPVGATAATDDDIPF